MRITESQLRRIIREELFREGTHGVPHPTNPEFTITIKRLPDGKWGYTATGPDPSYGTRNMRHPQGYHNQAAAFDAAAKHIDASLEYDARDREYRTPEATARREAEYQRVMRDLSARRGY